MDNGFWDFFFGFPLGWFMVAFLRNPRLWVKGQEKNAISPWWVFQPYIIAIVELINFLLSYLETDFWDISRTILLWVALLSEVVFFWIRKRKKVPEKESETQTK